MRPCVRFLTLRGTLAFLNLCKMFLVVIDATLSGLRVRCVWAKTVRNGNGYFRIAAKCLARKAQGCREASLGLICYTLLLARLGLYCVCPFCTFARVGGELGPGGGQQPAEGREIQPIHEILYLVAQFGARLQYAAEEVDWLVGSFIPCGSTSSLRQCAWSAP